MGIHAGVFGLGEAGSLISADLAAAGVTVTGYDPADVPTPPGVIRSKTPSGAVTGAVMVFSITPASEALTAIGQALKDIRGGCLFADLSSSSPGIKMQLADIAVSRDFDFIDVALMSTVPGKGIRTPSLASGPGAERFVATIQPFGMRVSFVSRDAGDAATRKLLRSVMMKGLAGTVIEAMRAAEKAGLTEWLWRNLADEITDADEALLSRLVEGSGPHALRRRHEMEASAEMLEELGVEPVMTRATIENLRGIPEHGLPRIPILPDN